MVNSDLYRNVTSLELDIIDELERMKIIDCHEHLMSEEERLLRYVDAFTLFSHYCIQDFLVAGMSLKSASDIFPYFNCTDNNWNPNKSLDERWKLFKPFYDLTKHTSYSRAAQIAMERFYGIENLNETTVHLLSQRIKDNNTPGLYSRVLADASNITTCISQNTISDDGLMKCVAWLPTIPRNIDDVNLWSSDDIGTFDDFLCTVSKKINDIKADNYIGVKQFISPLSTHLPDYKLANNLFNQLKQRNICELNETNGFSDYIYDYIAKEIAKNDLVFCVHTGYWGDYRNLNPSYLLPLVSKNPDTRFDVYHLGYPYVHESIMLAKNNPNVWLNMCWTYIISQEFAEKGLSEILDMIPTNKVLGFGGDYFVVEKVFGHLVMARESIARVLASRIIDKRLTFEEAISIANMWLWENPKNLYHI